ncbi:MAG: hypothetical protein ACK4M9_03600 [Anaerobacillus sp.]|uniref:hypothetical protein n=1 Tax=Anaerobacillus sp. TaxID=1872506 RepID=UPI00391D4F1F
MNKFSLKFILGVIILFATALLVSIIFNFSFANVSFVIGGFCCFATAGSQVFPHMSEANASTRTLGGYVPRTKFEEKLSNFNPFFFSSCLFIVVIFIFF